jgi:hypothetical protein
MSNVDLAQEFTNILIVAASLQATARSRPPDRVCCGTDDVDQEQKSNDHRGDAWCCRASLPLISWQHASAPGPVRRSLFGSAFPAGENEDGTAENYHLSLVRIS